MYKECKGGLSFERSSSKPTMRKYYQLILVIVALVSALLALYYHHQYIRIHNVMEVLNFFGKPGQTASTYDCSSINITNHDQKSLSFADPMPVWQRISDTHFAYSAFWEQTAHGTEIKVISVGTGNSDPRFNCSLWFEDRKEPVVGRFSFSLLDSKENSKNDVKETKIGNVNAYYFYCKTQEKIGVPYGTAFFKTDDLVPSEPLIPIQPITEKVLSENSTAVCIAPGLNPAFPRSLVFEFLSYHQLVGINNFVFYSKGVPHKTLRVLQNSTLWNLLGISLTVLPWNFPYPLAEANVAIKLAVEKDCILRAAGKVRNVAVLAWNEFIVPRYHRSLAVMFDNFDAGKKTTARFSIPRIVFCIEYDDDPHTEVSSPLILRKTAYSKQSGLDRPLHVYRPLLVSGDKVLALTTQSVSQGIAAVHHYTHCSKDDAQKLHVAEGSMAHDSAMHRFTEDLKKSRVLRAWFENKLLL
ncbi:uncharacterized protein [Anabrus simplex]|uniref:uncharacterized protein n=1 Tax=Anabrus simplex TaxID=316456 RepID=UPI0034DD0DE4